jgi:heptosyltransferase II
MGQPEKILVRGVNWLGDAVMTTPALQRLREAKREAHITLLTPGKLADLWRGHPSLDDVLSFAAGDSVFQTAARLRARRFDLAIVFPNSWRSAFEVFFARVPVRVGYARGGRSVLLTTALASRPGGTMRKRSISEIQQRIANHVPRETFPAEAHHVHDYLRLVAAAGASAMPMPPVLNVSDSEVDTLRKRFAFRDNVPLFGLNPGAEYGPAKRWPAERFVEAAVRLHQATGCEWLIVGGANDRALTESIAAEVSRRAPTCRVTNAAGETSLRELCAALRACDVVLTNDTGPMHVAAAIGTPVIVPFGSTSPELTGPSAELSEAVIGAAECAPCFLRECPVDFRCMKSISVEAVVQAVLRVWERQVRQ